MSQNPPSHGPIRFGRYLEIHQTVLTQLRADGFVGEDTLQIIPSPGSFLMSGEIACLGGIVIRVEKSLRVIEGYGANALVETVWYAYNASIRNQHNILRYDNQDEDISFRKHLDPHHKHTFDWQTGDELNVQWVGGEKWPRLDEVIQELREWYWTNRGALPFPDDYPAIGLR